MDYVAGGDGFDRAVDVHQQPTGGVDVDRTPPGCRPAVIAPRGPAPVAPAPPSRSARRRGTRRGALRARGCHRGCCGRDPHELGRDLRPVEVYADADHHRVARRLGEDPCELAVADEQVVRPLQIGEHAGRRRNGFRHRDRGRDHDHMAIVRSDTGTQQHRDEQRGTRRSAPRASEPAPSGPLMVGHDHQAVGRTGPSRIEQVAVRGVRLYEPTKLAEARRTGLGIGHGP